MFSKSGYCDDLVLLPQKNIQNIFGMHKNKLTFRKRLPESLSQWNLTAQLPILTKICSSEYQQIIQKVAQSDPNVQKSLRIVHRYWRSRSTVGLGVEGESWKAKVGQFCQNPTFFQAIFSGKFQYFFEISDVWKSSSYFWKGEKNIFSRQNF